MSTPTPKRSRAERRTVKAQARAFERARNASSSPPPRPQTLLAQDTPAPDQHRTGSVLGFVLASSAALATVMAGTWNGAPVLGHSWRWDWVAGATVAAGIYALIAARMARGLRSGLIAFVAGTGVVVAAIFAAGAATSVVINGEVQSAFSEPARAYRMTQQLQADLDTIAEHNELLVLEDADAQANIDRFEPAMADLVALNERYTELKTKPLPAPHFFDALNQTQIAAYHASEAMRLRRETLLAPNAKTTQDMVNSRIAATQALGTARQTTQDIIALYDFDPAQLQAP